MANPRVTLKALTPRTFTFDVGFGVGRVRAFTVPGTTRASVKVELENGKVGAHRVGTLGTVTGTIVVTLDGKGKFTAILTSSADTTIGLALEDTKPPVPVTGRTGGTQSSQTR